MELIRKKAFARAGLIGNPSDGYYGKTISIGLGNLWAQVSLYEWEQMCRSSTAVPAYSY